MKTVILLGFALSSATLFAQQAFYDITAGNGNGLRFWGSDNYKIHMGNTSEYQYGPVTDYSIKMNMNNTSGRGWTWGVVGLTPVAALNNDGNMQIAGKFTVSGNSNPINFTSFWHGSPDITTNVSEISNDVGAYKQLMIVGNRAQGGDRRVGIWDRLSIKGAGFSQTFNVNGGGYFAGNVGIGTTNPGSFKLAVEGKVGAREVVVMVDNWYDHVFEDGYYLPSLSELEEFIKTNKHLPEVPTASEVKEKGLALGEMNAILLKKVEELTLYLIDLKKENEMLKNRVENLEMK